MGGFIPSVPGPAGPTGATGAAGAAGTNGLSVLNGAGAPGAGVGSNGDFYIDTTANAIYGPKAAGAWGAGTSLFGPTGATGPAGANGTNAPDLTNIRRLITFASVRLAAGSVAGDYILYPGGIANVTALGTGFGLTPSSVAAFHFDPADYTIAGKTLNLILKLITFTNNAAPVATFVGKLYTVSTPAGGSGSNTIAGAAVAASAVSIATPAATSMTKAESAAFAAPVAGFYALGVNLDATTAAASTVFVRGDLYLVWA